MSTFNRINIWYSRSAGSIGIAFTSYAGDWVSILKQVVTTPLPNARQQLWVLQFLGYYHRDVPCHSRSGTYKNPHSSKISSTKYRSKFEAHHQRSDLCPDDIITSHRVGKHRSKPSQIIVRLNSVDIIQSFKICKEAWKTLRNLEHSHQRRSDQIPGQTYVPEQTIVLFRPTSQSLVN